MTTWDEIPCSGFAGQNDAGPARYP